jgi:phosphoenolpyruvate-protein phosphotransferase (PTS system enzyme I)
MQVFANIGGLSDVQAAIENGAEGVGLFRTEFLYLENSHWPTEEEQYEAYRQVVERFGQRPVIIRTLDIGGDKELPYAKLPVEENPFLGHRAIRFCLAEPDIFKVQLRALLRASTHGELWIMLPMIATLEEINETKVLLAECRQALLNEGHAVSEHIPVGIMIETPAAAVIADLLAPHVDFFSIGTNDLTQYTLAADRGNEQVAHLYQPHHPAVLRLIQMVCRAAHQAKIPVGVCGEFAGDATFTELLVGLGVAELSMSGRLIPAVKQRVRELNYKQSQTLAVQVLQQPTAVAVQVAMTTQA